MSTQLKDKLVVRDHEGQFHVWTKAEYEAYVTDAIWMGATPSISIVTHFAGTEDLLKDVAIPEASAPLPIKLEEAAKEASERYIEDETLQFQTVCRQQGYSLDIIEEWAKVDYRKGFLAGSRYQSQASLPGDIVEKIERVDAFPFFKTKEGKWFFCYNDIKRLNQHSPVFDTYELALQYYGTMCMVEWPDEYYPVSAQVSLKDHAVGFGNYLKKFASIEIGDRKILWWDRVTGGKNYETSELYDLWPDKNK